MLRKDKNEFEFDGSKYIFRFGLTNFSSCVFPYFVGLEKDGKWVGSTGVPEYKLKILRELSDGEMIKEFHDLFARYPYNKKSF